MRGRRRLLAIAAGFALLLAVIAWGRTTSGHGDTTGSTGAGLRTVQVPESAEKCSAPGAPSLTTGQAMFRWTPGGTVATPGLLSGLQPSVRNADGVGQLYTWTFNGAQWHFVGGQFAAVFSTKPRECVVAHWVVQINNGQYQLTAITYGNGKPWGQAVFAPGAETQQLIDQQGVGSLYPPKSFNPNNWLDWLPVAYADPQYCQVPVVVAATEGQRTLLWTDHPVGPTSNWDRRFGLQWVAPQVQDQISGLPGAAVSTTPEVVLKGKGFQRVAYTYELPPGWHIASAQYSAFVAGPEAAPYGCNTVDFRRGTVNGQTALVASLPTVWSGHMMWFSVTISNS